MNGIIFSNQSLENINDIRKYIALDSVVISEKVISCIFETIKYLSVFPSLWVKKWNYSHIIEPIYKYTIRYRVQDDTIYIVTIYKYQNN